MDKPILKDSMRLFEPLGYIKSRSMFGGFGIFSDDTMFALVVNNTLHIRANAALTQEFEARGLRPYTYKKRGFPVVTKYFALTDDLNIETQKTLELAKLALNAANMEKKNQCQTKSTRLKDLPNLRLTTERMLKKAGIHSVSNLKEIGAAYAFKAVKSTHSSDVSLDLLWALEGAIQGTHWSVISQNRRQELLAQLDS